MMTKKILSLLLALIICFTSVPVAFAGEGDFAEITDSYIEDTTTEEPTTEGTTEEPTTEDSTPDEEETTTLPLIPETPTSPEVPDVPEVPDTPEMPEVDKPSDGDEYDENEIVADFYVFLIESKPHPIGHTWVYVENLTDRELQVGLYKLPPNEGVAVGVLARPDGWGIYYNVESYAQHAHGMGKRISMKDQLTAKKLKRVSDTIINYVNHWDPIFNCMYFAFRVWNSGSRKILLPLLLPVFGKLQMAIYRHEFNVEMKPVRRDQCFRQVGSGRRAYLRPISDDSLTLV